MSGHIPNVDNGHPPGLGACTVFQGSSTGLGQDASMGMHACHADSMILHRHAQAFMHRERPI